MGLGNLDGLEKSDEKAEIERKGWIGGIGRIEWDEKDWMERKNWMRKLNLKG